MRFLVTGSRGFVGKRLAGALKERGESVREFDLALGNDLASREQCRKAVKGVDAVYHLAAVLDENSPTLFKVNVQGTENMLQAAVEQKCRQFVHLGTAGVHAGCRGEADEESAFRPATRYEESKAMGERVVQEFQEMLPVTVLRSALVLGPNAYWKQIVGMVERGFPLIGKGKQVWQTIYISDLVDALLFVRGKRECEGEAFIVAEREKHSLRELYGEIQKALGMQVRVKSVPKIVAKIGAMLRLGGGIVNSAHIERLARERNYNTRKIEALGWKAKTGMKEAVQKTVAELKSG